MECGCSRGRCRGIHRARKTKALCDPTETAPGTGWRGWNTSDVLRSTKAAGDWVDLSWPAAEWLVDKKIKLLAVDTPTPDIPIHKRPRGFDWPVHHTLLRDGVLISEQVANARSLAGRPAELLFLPLNIVGGDGAPARVLGRAIRD